jgi:methionyl-tRNA synthetase
VLRSLAEGLRVVTVLLHAYMPETTERLMGALGQDGGFSIDGARFGAAGSGTVTPLDPPLFPKQA